MLYSCKCKGWDTDLKIGSLNLKKSQSSSNFITKGKNINKMTTCKIVKKNVKRQVCIAVFWRRDKGGSKTSVGAWD